jgi:hypothetical protein
MLHCTIVALHHYVAVRHCLNDVALHHYVAVQYVAMHHFTL